MNVYPKQRNSAQSLDASSGRSGELEQARAYCRRLATTHYENFVVGSILVPRRFLQHLYNVYAFCRHSDDLADEIGDSARSLEMLAQWRGELNLCYTERPSHPILVALQDTIKAFDIPSTPFEDLISAFEQDCRVTRYATYDDLTDYCRRSANPVGRLFLWLFGYRDQERQALSDSICTALQLANFWQDVASDYARGRVYIPLEDMASFGCHETDIADSRMTPAMAELFRFQVDRTQRLFDEGSGLPAMIGRRLAVDVELFRLGGMAVLDGIRQNEYDVLTRRPVVSKKQQAGLFVRSLLRAVRFANS